jgi:hypothetical protein
MTPSPAYYAIQFLRPGAVAFEFLTTGRSCLLKAKEPRRWPSRAVARHHAQRIEALNPGFTAWVVPFPVNASDEVSAGPSPTG